MRTPLAARVELRSPERKVLDMGKRDVNRKVNEAMRALTSNKEEAVRNLIEALDAVASKDEQVRKVVDERGRLLQDAADAHKQARSAGWRARDLNGAGLVLPKQLTVKGMTPDRDVADSLENENAAPEEQVQGDGVQVEEQAAKSINS